MPIASAFITALSEKDYPDFKATDKGLVVGNVKTTPLFYFTPGDYVAGAYGELGDSFVKAKPCDKDTTEQDMHWYRILDYKDTLYVYNSTNKSILNICMGRAPITEAKLEFSLILSGQQNNSIATLVGTKPGVSLQGCTSLEMLKHKCELFVQFNMTSMLVLTYHPLNTYYNAAETDAFFSKFANDLAYTLDSTNRVVPTDVLQKVLQGTEKAKYVEGMLYQVTETDTDEMEQDDRDDELGTASDLRKPVAFLEGNVKAYCTALKEKASLSEGMWSVLDTIADTNSVIVKDLLCLTLASHKYQFVGTGIAGIFDELIDDSADTKTKRRIKEAFDKEYISVLGLHLYIVEGILVASPMLLQGLVSGAKGYKTYALISQALQDNTPVESVSDLLTIDHLYDGMMKRSKAAGIKNFEYKFEYNNSDGLLDTIVLQNAALRLIEKNDDRVHRSDIYNLVAAPNTFINNASGLKTYKYSRMSKGDFPDASWFNTAYTALTGGQKGWYRKVPFNLAIMYIAIQERAFEKSIGCYETFCDMESEVMETAKAGYVRDWQRFILPEFEVFGRTTFDQYTLRGLLFVMQFYRLYPLAALMFGHNDASMGVWSRDDERTFREGLHKAIPRVLNILYLVGSITPRGIDIALSDKLADIADMQLFLQAYKKILAMYKECKATSMSIAECFDKFSNRLNYYIKARDVHYVMSLGADDTPKPEVDRDVGTDYWRTVTKWFIDTDYTALEKTAERDAAYDYALKGYRKSYAKMRIVYDYLEEKGYTKQVPFAALSDSMKSATRYAARCLSTRFGFIEPKYTMEEALLKNLDCKVFVTNVNTVCVSYTAKTVGFAESFISCALEVYLETLLTDCTESGTFNLARFNEVCNERYEKFKAYMNLHIQAMDTYLSFVPIRELLFMSKEAPNLVMLLPHIGFATMWCMEDAHVLSDVQTTYKAYFDMLLNKRHEYGLLGYIPFFDLQEVIPTEAVDKPDFLPALLERYPNRPTYAVIPRDKVKEYLTRDSQTFETVLSVRPFIIMQSGPFRTVYTDILSIKESAYKTSEAYIDTLMHYYNECLPADFDCTKYETFTYVVHTLIQDALRVPNCSNNSYLGTENIKEYRILGTQVLSALKTVLELQQYVISDKTLGTAYSAYYERNK